MMLIDSKYLTNRPITAIGNRVEETYPCFVHNSVKSDNTISHVILVVCEVQLYCQTILDVGLPLPDGLS